MKTLVLINEDQYKDENLAELFSNMSENGIKFEILDLAKKENHFQLIALLFLQQL